MRLDATNTKSVYSLLAAHLYGSERVKNWPGAIADASKVIRLDPKNAEAFVVRAAAESRAGDSRRAVDDATEAIRLDPTNIYAYAHRGGAYKDLGEWKARDRSI